MLHVIARLPGSSGDELSEHGAAIPLAGGRPIQFVDVYPRTADRQGRSVSRVPGRPVARGPVRLSAGPGDGGVSARPHLLKPRDSWLGIEIRHFAALAAVASEHSFRGAAERLGYVQSAISRQIAYLEHATGSRLIERSQGPGPVRLTEAGELLLAHAGAILGSLDAAQDDLAKVQIAPVDEVRVGFFPGVATRILPAALVAFGRRRPDVRVVARESGTDKPLYDLLRRGSIDLAFAHLPAQEAPFESCELLEVPWALVVPAGSELAEREAPPTLEEIARLPLIGSSSDSAPWS